eukprot:2138478-Prymnesium_polylepis.1
MAKKIDRKEPRQASVQARLTLSHARRVRLPHVGLPHNHQISRSLEQPMGPERHTGYVQQSAVHELLVIPQRRINGEHHSR